MTVHPASTRLASNSRISENINEVHRGAVGVKSQGWVGRGAPSPDPYLLGSFPTPPGNISWRARVAKRNATRRGLGRAPPPPPPPGMHRPLRERPRRERAGG